MASELKQIMTLIDNNSNGIKEGDYLQICNLLMSVHKAFHTPEPPMVDPQYAASLPLPPLSVPFTPDINLGLNRVPTQRRLDFSAFVTPEIEPETRTDFQIYIDERIRVINKSKWKRMSDNRKIEALTHFYDFNDNTELRLGDMEWSLNLSSSELSELYKSYMNLINQNYDDAIRELMSFQNEHSHIF